MYIVTEYDDNLNELIDIRRISCYFYAYSSYGELSKCIKMFNQYCCGEIPIFKNYANEW